MIKSGKKYPTLYVKFQLGKHQFKIEEVIRGVTDNYVITFVLFQTFWFLEHIYVHSRH